jgi:hypothetical protein
VQAIEHELQLAGDASERSPMRYDAVPRPWQHAARRGRTGLVHVEARRIAEEARQPAVVCPEPREERVVHADLAVALDHDDREIAHDATDRAPPCLGGFEVAQLLVEHAPEDDPGDAHRARSGQRFGRRARPADDDSAGGPSVDCRRSELVAGIVDRDQDRPVDRAAATADAGHQRSADADLDRIRGHCLHLAPNVAEDRLRGAEWRNQCRAVVRVVPQEHARLRDRDLSRAVRCEPLPGLERRAGPDVDEVRGGRRGAAQP